MGGEVEPVLTEEGEEYDRPHHPRASARALTRQGHTIISPRDSLVYQRRLSQLPERLLSERRRFLTCHMAYVLGGGVPTHLLG